MILVFKPLFERYLHYVHRVLKNCAVQWPGLSRFVPVLVAALCAPALNAFEANDTADGSGEIPKWAQRLDAQTAGANEARLAENQIKARVYVDQNASRDGDGSKERPFHSAADGFEAVVAHVEAGRPAKLVIAPGVYREGLGRIDTLAGRARETLLIIEGAGPEATIFTGADPWPAARWTDHGGGLFSAPWPHDYGHVAPPWGPTGYLAHRSEMVFINGKMLIQALIEPFTVERTAPLRVGTPAELVYEKQPVRNPREALEPGAFGVAERDDSGQWANRIFVRPEDPSAFREAEIEVSVRATILNINGPKENLVLRGLTFTQANGQRQGGSRMGPIRFRGGADNAVKNLLIEDCHFLWNNDTGLRLPHTQKITIRNSRFDYNGDGGINFADSRYSKLEGNSTSFNNWRGHWGDYRGWAMGGIKFHVAEFNILRDHMAIGNLSPGIWYDIQCEHILVDQLVTAYNDRNLFFEIGNGPYFVDRSVIAMGHRVGLHILITGPVVVRDSVFYNNSDFRHNRESVPAPVFDVLYGRREHSYHKTQRLVRPGTNRFENSVFVAGPRQEVLAVIRPARHFDEQGYGFRYIGENNLFFAENRRQTDDLFVYVHTRGDWKNEYGDLADFKQWADASNAQYADPRFAGPARLDFRVPPESPVYGRERLPLAAIDPVWVERTRDFFDWAGWDAFDEDLRFADNVR